MKIDLRSNIGTFLASLLSVDVCYLHVRFEAVFKQMQSSV